MNNQELELKLKELLAIENFFDMIEEVQLFEKDYKATDFYKKTKMSLVEVIKGGKAWYSLQLNGIANKIQSLIDSLDFTKMNNILDELGGFYAQENEEALNIFKEFKEIVK